MTDQVRISPWWKSRSWRLVAAAAAAAATAMLTAALGLHFASTAGSAPDRDSRARSPLSAAMSWRMKGLSTHGTSGSASWSVRVREAHVVAARIGPFRFLPLKTLDLQDLHFEIVEQSPEDASPSTLQEGVMNLAETVAAGEHASRVAVHGLHFDIRDKDGRLLCCLSAQEADWSARIGNHSGIELRKSVLLSSGAESWTADRAQIQSPAWSLVASHWDSRAGGEDPLHPGEATAGRCPFSIASAPAAS